MKTCRLLRRLLRGLIWTGGAVAGMAGFGLLRLGLGWGWAVPGAIISMRVVAVTADDRENDSTVMAIQRPAG